MRRCISITGCVRPSVGRSVRPSVGPSVPSYFQTRTRRILCRVSGLVFFLQKWCYLVATMWINTVHLKLRHMFFDKSLWYTESYEQMSYCGILLYLVHCPMSFHVMNLDSLIYPSFIYPLIDLPLSSPWSRLSRPLRMVCRKFSLKVFASKISFWSSFKMAAEPRKCASVEVDESSSSWKGGGRGRGDWEMDET